MIVNSILRPVPLLYRPKERRSSRTPIAVSRGRWPFMFAANRHLC